MSDNEESSNKKFKMGVSLWLSICVFACLWFVSRFMTGRRQLRNNLHVIEDGLRRMQEEIERRQRENSISYGENLEEIMEELKKDGVMNEEMKDKEAQDKGTKPNKEKLEGEETEPLVVQDKKND
ncbi:uncharacterized protein LOC123007852 [Tribolium madens]|uniref:uncharacterized protein LOC123007852 n=1 Tax=Tribolium madens TaxID=41895 RepID=UPI001CF75CD7|nr:uncharacterized protein LOC123007852 [Tribolium madens]